MPDLPSSRDGLFESRPRPGKTDRHRHVGTAGRRARTGHLVNLEQSRGTSAGQPTPQWTECVGGTGSPLVRERADQHVPPSVPSAGRGRDAGLDLPHKLPVALVGGRATFLFVQTDEDETVSAVRTWGSEHPALWTALLATPRAVEVVVVRRRGP